MNVTRDQIKAALNALMAVADAIRAAQQIPSGRLYAALMTKLDLAAYNKIIDQLKRAELVREQNGMLVWCGPQLETK